MIITSKIDFFKFYSFWDPFHYSILSGDRVVLGEVGLVVAVTDSVEGGRSARAQTGLQRVWHAKRTGGFS